MLSDQPTSRAYWVFILIPLAALAVFYLYPLVKLLSLSVTVPKPGFGNFERLLTSEAIWRIVGNTARISAITSLVALVVGYVIAYTMMHVSSQHRTWILFIVLLSFWLSVLIRAFAWL